MMRDLIHALLILVMWLAFVCCMAIFCVWKCRAEDLAAGNLRISPESRELIIYYETGGEAYYRRYEQHPEVPPGASGVTIGVGYDCGYNTAAQIASDWNAYLDPGQIMRLQSVAGKRGAMARAVLARVRDIIVPWESALAVYESKTVPRFAAMTEHTYPGITLAPPDIQGVMLSTTFNRGTDLREKRRQELLWSRCDIITGNYTRLPDYQIGMRRLWPGIPGLLRRYAAHAGLMQRALGK